MHFVRVRVNEDKLEKAVKALEGDDLKAFHDIPRIPDEVGVWVSLTDLAKVQELLGDAVEGWDTFDYKDNTKVKFGKGLKRAVPILLELLREVAVLLDFDVVYVLGEGDTLPNMEAELRNPRNFFVFNNTLPPGMRGQRQGKSRLRFGTFEVVVPTSVKLTFMKIRDRNTIYDTIKDDDGTPVACGRDNRLWLPFDIGAHRGGFNRQWYPTLVAREAIARFFAKQATRCAPKLADREKELEKCRADFITHCRADIDRQRIEMERELNEKRQRVKTLETSIAALYDEIRRDQVVVAGLERPEGRNDFLNKQFDDILKYIPLVRKLEFTNQGLTFETDIINLENDSCMREQVKHDPFPLGRYKVRLRRGHDPEIRNLTHRLNYRAGGMHGPWDHPHVHNTSPCLGNITGKVARMISEDKWFGVITYLIEALKTWYSDDAWSRGGFDHWKRASVNVADREMDEDKKDRIKNWVSYRHRMPLGLIAEIGDEVVATCPDTCPMKGGKCQFEGDGVHTGKIENFYDDRVEVLWEKDDQIFRCPGFTYDSVKFLNGTDIIQGFGEVENHTPTRAVVEDEDNDVPQGFEMEGFRFTYDHAHDRYDGYHAQANVNVTIGRAQYLEAGEAVLRTLLQQAAAADRTTQEEHQQQMEAELRGTDEEFQEHVAAIAEAIDQDIMGRMRRMAEAQRVERDVTTINLETEDAPVEPVDPRWADELDDEVTPEDDEVLEAFNDGLLADFPMDF